MSCRDCKEAQERGIFYYYRWKNANIAISGCKKHVKEIIDCLNENKEIIKKIERKIRKLSKEWYVAPKVLEELAKYEG
jgi:hypothetical protein